MTRRTRRGFTLVEMIMAILIFAIVSTAVFLFARTQIRARKQTQYFLDTEQNARVVVDAIRADLQSSGLGVGYSLGGAFLGIQMGPFGSPSGTFTSNDFVHPGGQVSDDLRIRGALGPARTIAEYDAPASSGNMEVCAGGGFQVGDKVLILSESYTDARAIDIVGVTAVTCTNGQCEIAGGCDRLTYTDASATFATDASAEFASYLGGTAFRGFIDVTYFVHWNGATPALYRSETPCASRLACAIPTNLLGEGVESLQMRIWEHDPASPNATDVTVNGTYVTAGGVTSENRIRVELEVISRSRTEEGETPQNQVCSNIQPASCFPMGVNVFDMFRRRRMMTAIELKNSGRMRFQALR